MPRWLIPLIVLIVVATLIEVYAFQSIKTLTKSKYIRWFWIGTSLFAYAYFLITMFTMPSGGGQTPRFQFAFGLLLLCMVPKLLISIVMLGEDVVRLISKGCTYFIAGDPQPIPGRREFMSKLAIGLAAIPFTTFLYGIIKGRYNYKVLKYELAFDDLPEAFDGFTLTQISDIHSGSFTNKEKIQYGVDLINEQKSDVILFTGDIVNNFAYEMDNWIDVFKQLKAPMGKFSILGNHDYGDYSQWDSREAKAKNFEDILKVHQDIGFDLLRNENRMIEKNGQRLALVGVENWGKSFKKKGDLDKASEGVTQDDFKILMSHDPSHWEYKVKEDARNYQLTLSGHTHGLQFGIEIPGWIKWSPSKYFYKQWAGLYEEFGRYINVNRGFGYHALPGRIGIWPEVTVIELKKRVNNA